MGGGKRFCCGSRLSPCVRERRGQGERWEMLLGEARGASRCRAREKARCSRTCPQKTGIKLYGTGGGMRGFLAEVMRGRELVGIFCMPERKKGLKTDGTVAAMILR